MLELINQSSDDSRIQHYMNTAPPELKTASVIDYLCDIGYFSAPASNYYNAYRGGLYVHSCILTNVFREANQMYSLPVEDNRLEFVVGMFHDLCVLKRYEKSTHTLRDEPEVLMAKEYGKQSLEYLKNFYEPSDLERLCILWHRGSYVGRSDWDEFIQVVKQCKLVYNVYSCNVIASYLIEK